MNSGSCSQMSSWKWPIGVNTCYYNIATSTVFSPGGGAGGGETPIWTGQGCSLEIKETNLGVAQRFFWPIKAIILNFDYMDRVNFFSSATLKETFTAKYNAVLPRKP